MATLDQPIIVPWIRLDRDAKAEEALALARAREPWCAGFCLFGGEASQVAAFTTRLRDAAGRPLFIASDMERGAGQQVKGLRVLPDAAIWGLGATPAEAQSFGEITAREARSVGVDVLFAPVLDVRSAPNNPIVGNRAFGWSPDQVAEWGRAFVRGALEGGCAPTAKHWPGHGATRQDSHDAIPVVDDDAELLEERDLHPFLVAIEDGCPAVMTAHVAYPALDPSGGVATFSSEIVRRLLEAAFEAEFELAVFTDALLMAGAAVPGGETEAARRALRAGCHALLIPSDPERLAAELLDEADEDLEDLEVAVHDGVEGLAGLLDQISLLEPLPAELPDALASLPGRVADRAARRQGLNVLQGIGRAGATILVIDDDDVAARGEVLRRRGLAAGSQVVLVRAGREGLRAPPPGGLAPDVVVVMSSVRAWKGDANLSPASLALARTFRASGCPFVWLTPRPAFDGPHVPGTGPDVEEALAACFFD